MATEGLGPDAPEMEDRRDLKRGVRKVLEVMETEWISLVTDDEGVIWFEKRGPRSGQIIKVPYSDMARAFLC